MAWKYGFFDPVEVEPGVYDREYNSEEFSRPFSALIDTGVLQGAGGELEVTADGISMDTTIASGIAFINGRFAENIGTVTHTHDTESVEVDRIDRIVIRLDLRPETRSMESYIKKGVASENPSPPALQRDQYVYEISLAQVYIKGGQSYIEQTNIIDERGDDTLCPWARSKVLPSYDQQDLNDLKDEFDAHKADYAQLKDSSEIVEEGSNENGWYTRWASGLQICYAAFALGDDDDYFSWTFPAQFKERYFASGTVRRSTTNFESHDVTESTSVSSVNSQFNCQINSQVKSNRSLYLFAIGRWK